MRTIQRDELVLFDYEPKLGSFAEEALAGLRQRPKTLPSKFFYDERGAILFEQICQVDDYYPTRTELAIMSEHVGEMADALGERCRLIEFGSGEGVKTRQLLEAMHEPAAYVPIDIAKEQLFTTAQSLMEQFEDLTVQPICADYTQNLELPPPPGDVNVTAAYFPGSTIGNFVPEAAMAFLRRIARMVGSGGELLLGADRKKHKEVLEAAYNDRDGVTAAFNLNLLHRINRELEGSFDVDAFEHRAVYREWPGRIEMHLVSRKAQTVRVANEEFSFAAGETILTEYSHKYSLDDLQALARDSGFRIARIWSDPEDMFSVLLLTVD